MLADRERGNEEKRVVGASVVDDSGKGSARLSILRLGLGSRIWIGVQGALKNRCKQMQWLESINCCLHYIPALYVASGTIFDNSTIAHIYHRFWYENAFMAVQSHYVLLLA